MIAITTLGDTWVVIFIASIFVVFLARRRRYYWAGVTGLSVFGGMLLNRFLKLVFLRPRPSFDEPILSIHWVQFSEWTHDGRDSAFRHLRRLFFSRTIEPRRRVLIVFVAALLIALVAFSRIYLGAHYLSDVLGAVAEGLAWLSLCLTVCHYLRRPEKRLELKFKLDFPLGVTTVERGNGQFERG